MPFCVHCGTEVAGSAAFCQSCGGAQPGVEKPQAKAKSFLGDISPRTASILCYLPVIGWVPCVIVLAADRFLHERDTRFHAFQGLFLFVAWLILDWGGPFFGMVPGWKFGLTITGIFKMVIFAAWIFMIIKTSQNEHYRLPLFGELADRSLKEQR